MAQAVQGRARTWKMTQEVEPKTQRIDANVDRVWTLVHSVRSVGLRVIAEELNMIRKTVWQIVKENL
jgi:hypothetical protein